MIVIRGVERVEDAVVDGAGGAVIAHMVDDNVNHQVHSAVVQRFRESLEVGCCAIVLVDAVDILLEMMSGTLLSNRLGEVLPPSSHGMHFHLVCYPRDSSRLVRSRSIQRQS